MGDFTATTTVDADEAALFDYLSQVQNLPRYFARMTSARPGDGQEVRITAQMPDGTEVEGDAWFRVDKRTRMIVWGVEGDNDYHGSLEVTATSRGSHVQVVVRTTRVPDGDSEVQRGLEQTLATLKRIAESR